LARFFKQPPGRCSTGEASEFRWRREKLESLSPLGVLARGYAIAFDKQGRVIKHASDVGSGERVRVRVSEGEMDCTKN